MSGTHTHSVNNAQPITFYIEDGNGFQVAIAALPTLSMGRVYLAYAERQALAPGNFSFSYNGNILRPSITVGDAMTQYGLSNDSVVRVSITHHY